MWFIWVFLTKETRKSLDMIADYNTMPRMFWECNRLYFDHSLPTPKFGLMKKLNRLARFEYFKNN